MVIVRTPTDKMMMWKKMSVVEMMVAVVTVLLLLLVLRETPLGPMVQLAPSTPDGGRKPVLVGGACGWPDFLVFAEAAPVVCTTNLADATPAEGETVNIQAGECSGDITVSNDNVAVIIHPGAGEFQTGKYIIITASSANFTLDVSGVEWDLDGATDLLFISSAWSSTSSTTTLTDSTISIRDSTISGYGSLTLGSMSNTAVSLQGSTMSAVSAGLQYGIYFSGSVADSALDIYDSSITTSASGGYSYGVFFLATLSNTTLKVRGSNLTVLGSSFAFGIYVLQSVSDTTLEVSGSNITASSSIYSASGVYFVGSMTASTVAVSDSTVSMTTSSDRTSYALYFSGALTDSTVAVSDSNITAASLVSRTYGFYFYDYLTNSTVAVSGSTVTTTGESRTQGITFIGSSTDSRVALSGSTVTGTADTQAHALWFYGALTDSTVAVSDSTMTTTASTGYGILFQSAVTTSTVEVSGSSLTASSFSLLYSADEVSTIILRSSTFTGARDGPGPVSTGNRATAVGSLTAQCTYWNSDEDFLNVLAASYTSIYTSTQLSSKSLPGDCTATPSATSPATLTASNSPPLPEAPRTSSLTFQSPTSSRSLTSMAGDVDRRIRTGTVSGGNIGSAATVTRTSTHAQADDDGAAHDDAVILTQEDSGEDGGLPWWTILLIVLLLLLLCLACCIIFCYMLWKAKEEDASVAEEQPTPKYEGSSDPFECTEISVTSAVVATEAEEEEVPGNHERPEADPTPFPEAVPCLRQRALASPKFLLGLSLAVVTKEGSAGTKMVINSLCIDGPAHSQGLMLNDIVLSIGGRRVHTSDESRNAIKTSAKVGQPLTVVIARPAQGNESVTQEMTFNVPVRTTDVTFAELTDLYFDATSHQKAVSGEEQQ